MESIIQETIDDPDPVRAIDFENTEIAFASKTDKELKWMSKLFTLMNVSWLVSIGSKLGLWGIKLHIPFVKNIIKNTIFDHFCGGTNLLDCQENIDKLRQNNSLTILDYGAEAKSTEEDFIHVTKETIKAIEFAASNSSVPVVSTKLTGIIDNDLLIKIQSGENLTSGEKSEYEKWVHRFDKICTRAAELGVGIFVDAEESWLQKPIDDLVVQMMAKHNKERIIVYNTYQLYLKSKLQQLKNDHKKALDQGYILGAKLVRGAYMDKERDRASEMGYPSPIHDTKVDTDRDFDQGITYCVENYKTIASCCASHNVKSNHLQAILIHEKGAPKTHRHLNFCQLYGMGDYITFNIGQHGYNVAKYMPYGPIDEVIPYLIRRAQENTSVSGEMSRELLLIKKEIKRRGL